MGLDIATAVTAGAGLAGNIISGIGAGKRAKKLMDRQHNYNKEIMDIQNNYLTQQNLQNQKIQMENWENTSYGAQVDQMKKAGLNIGLMYEGGGAGGSTMGSQTASAPSGGGGYSDMGVTAKGMDIMSQVGMQMAQMDLIKAQTKKTEAEAKKTEGVDTEKILTEIQSLTQGIKNAEAQETAIHIDNSLKRVELRVKEATAEESIRLLENQAEQSIYDLKMIQRLDKFDEQTYDARVKTLIENLGLIVAQRQKTEADTDVLKLTKEYYGAYFELEKMNAETNRMNARTNEKNANINQVNAVTNRIGVTTGQQSTMNQYELDTKKQELQKKLNDHNMLHDDINLILNLPSKIFSAIKIWQ